MQMDKKCFFTAIANSRELELFINYTLPSILSKNNIPSITNKYITEYLIWASEDYVDSLNKSNAIAQLSNYCEVSIKGISRYFFMGKSSSIISALYRGMLEYSQKNNFGIISVQPDAIWADGNVFKIDQKANEGIRAILAGSILTHSKDILDTLKISDNRESEILSVPHRKLVQILLNDEHPITSSQIIDNINFSTWPTSIFWSLGDEGYLQRTTELFPIYLYPRINVTNFRESYASDFLESAVPDKKDHYICDNSDEILIVRINFEDNDRGIPDRMNLANDVSFALWLNKFNTLQGKGYLKHHIWIHTGADPKNWQSTLKQSNMFIQKSLAFADAITKNSNI